MKKFTVKDFISYNNPCFSCGENIHFKVVTTTKDGPSDIVQLRPTVKPDYTVVDLKVTYTKTLQLWIFHQNNKIISSDIRGLTSYLEEHKLFLSSRCDKCYTNIESNFLEFNLDKGYVKPVGISRELLIVSDEHNMYQIHSSFIAEQSTVVVDKISKTTPISPVRFEAPLLPLYKFKDKEHLINKMKTYLIFS